MVLELARDRALDRPVPRIVHPRCHFVEHRAVRGGEELDREHADIIECIGDLAGQFARFLDLRDDRHRGWYGRARQDAPLVVVFGAVVKGDRAI